MLSWPAAPAAFLLVLVQEYVLPVMLHAWLQCLQLGQPQLLQQTELLSASFYWLLAELLWML